MFHWGFLCSTQLQLRPNDMGASSSGLLDEAKASHISGLVDSSFQRFSVFYREQYPAAYFRHLQQEVEPKKQERRLLLTQRPRSDPEEVLYKSRARFSTWDDQSRKGKDKYVVVKRNYSLEIHESQEAFLRGSVAKCVLQPARGAALTSEDEAQAALDQSCSGILDGVREDSSPPASRPEGFAVHLHLPHTGLYCFLFQHDSERHHFLSALKSCVRHRSLDPWSEASYESQAFVQALRLYRRDRGCYECWDVLLGSEEQVLGAQLMEEVLPWLQSQLQNKVKGKKMERIRLWLATVHAAHTVVLERLRPGLEALREECRGSASANQGLIRANLDQITASHSFLLEKIQGRVSEEAERACGEFISPYLPSVLDALTENIRPALQEMRQTLQTQIHSALEEKGGGSEVTKKVSSLTRTGLEKCYQQVEKLKEDLSALRERFGLSSSERLVHAAHLDLEKLLDSAVYTFELFLRTSARLQPDEYGVKTNRAKERVLKQLDYDSRLVQKRLYEEALLQIALPTLNKRVDNTWKNELQSLEQYIFSDFSSFILVQNVYQEVLRNILNKEIQKVLQEATSKTSSDLLLDTSDLAISQYSLLGQTPIPSTPNSPTLFPRDILPTTDTELTADKNPIGNGNNQGTQIGQVKEIAAPVIVVSREIDDNSTANSREIQSDPVMDLLQYESSDSESVKIWEEISDSDPLEALESLTSFEDALDEVSQSGSARITTTTEAHGLEKLPEDSNGCRSTASSGSPTSQAENPMKISLETLSEAIVCDATENVTHQSTDKAIYLKGPIMENWKSESQEEAVKRDQSPPGDGATQQKKVTDEEIEEIEEIANGQSVGKIDGKVQNAEVADYITSCKEEEATGSQTTETQRGNNAEQPWDGVAAIRDLVTEVTEVQITINPCPAVTE